MNFWRDKWLNNLVSVVELLNIPADLQDSLSASVQDFIRNGNWYLPFELNDRYPA